MRYEDDTRYQVGAYIHNEKSLYRVLRLERNGTGQQSIKVWLENAHGERMGDTGEYHYSHRMVGARDLARSFQLALAAPPEAATPLDTVPA